jgi:rhodanese-related sulfurtransferase
VRIWHSASGHPTILDANGDKTRTEDGIIPGAKLLTSSSEYDIARELPAAKDSDLVFYCANTKCMASHSAASRAMNAGYTHVAVLADGIQGWKAAGQQTAKP